MRLEGSAASGRGWDPMRNDPDRTREEPEPPLEEELDEAAELLPQQEPEDAASPAELDPLLTDPAD